MAANKTWAGVSQTDATTAAGDYSVADNWLPISLVNSSFQWTASGSGTNEFYLEASGGGDPGIDEPTNVQENLSAIRTNMSAGTAGSLAAGAWDWADNDTLGFSTVYVRLTSGTADPDSRDDAHVTYTAIPVATDDVRIPATSTQAITAGLDQSGVAIGDFIVEAGYTSDIGLNRINTATGGAFGGYLLIDPNRFEFAGEGESYIDIGSANINCQILNTASPNEGERGLYLLGSNIATLNVQAGFVGVAVKHEETATIATARVSGGDVWLGEGVSLTTADVTGGSMVQRCSCTTANVYGGTHTTEEAGTITTVNAHGGLHIGNSTGTVTTLNMEGGDVDHTQSTAARTVTTLNINDDSGSLKGGPWMTYTNRNFPSKPFTMAVSNG